MATNGRVRGNATRATVPHLLKGLVFGNDGGALSPFHTTKKSGRRYRDDVPQRENKEHAGASGLPRLPAAELESAVLEQLRVLLRSPALLGDVLLRAIELDSNLDEAKLTVAMTRLDTIGDQLFPAEPTRIVKLLVEKVIVSPNDLEVRLRANGIERLVLELQLALAMGQRWLAMLESGEAKSLREIATREGIDNSYVSRMVNLTMLAPDIVAAILDDTLPNHVTLFDLAVDPPALWDEQRARVEF